MSTVISKIGAEPWLDTLKSSLTNRALVSPFGDPLPAFPSEEMQRNTTSLAGPDALEQANGFYNDVSEALERAGHPIMMDWQILDFGSCWGRISRFFMRDVPLKNIHGIDVEETFVETCKILFNSQNFIACGKLPPCEFEDSSISLITAYSVFSHLSEAAFLAWLSEFHRILEKEGVVAFTTRNQMFFDYCNRLRSQRDELSGYQKALADMMPDIHDFRERYGNGEFIFATGSGVSGGGAMDESFYGEAFIPRAYIDRVLGNSFEVLEFKAVGNGYDQALVVLKKRM